MVANRCRPGSRLSPTRPAPRLHVGFQLDVKIVRKHAEMGVYAAPVVTKGTRSGNPDKIGRQTRMPKNAPQHDKAMNDLHRASIRSLRCDRLTPNQRKYFSDSRPALLPVRMVRRGPRSHNIQSLVDDRGPNLRIRLPRPDRRLLPQTRLGASKKYLSPTKPALPL